MCLSTTATLKAKEGLLTMLINKVNQSFWLCMCLGLGKSGQSRLDGKCLWPQQAGAFLRFVSSCLLSTCVYLPPSFFQYSSFYSSSFFCPSPCAKPLGVFATSVSGMSLWGTHSRWASACLRVSTAATLPCFKKAELSRICIHRKIELRVNGLFTCNPTSGLVGCPRFQCNFQTHL